MKKARKIRMVDFNEESQAFINCRTTRGFPLGGIGNGGFSVFTDGGLGEFRTQHNWFAAVKNPKGTFFGIWAKRKGVSTAKILRRGYRGGKEYLNVENIQNTKFIGKIPQFSCEFNDAAIPLLIKLKGFSPLIPQNPKDSSLPVSFLIFEIKNPTESKAEVSVLFSFENILGLGGSGGAIFFIRNGPVKYKSTKGNYNEDIESKNLSGIMFKSKQDYKPNNPRRRVIGEYSINVITSEDPSLEISKCVSWDTKQPECSLWKQFSNSGTLDNNIEGKSKRIAGAVAVKFELEANSTKKIEFLLSWWIPYYVIEKSPKIRKVIGMHKGIDHGHYFLNYFKNHQELSDYAIQERMRLYDESCQLQIILEESSLPSWLTTLILNMTDSILINSLFTKSGNYYAMEGVPWSWPFGALTGTNDQRLASHPYTSVFFPSLDKAELEAFRHLTENGKVPHGNGNADLALGNADVPYGKPIKALNKTKDWIDLTMSEICQIGKLILITGDTEYLKEVWGDLIRMAEYLHKNTIDGIPEGGSTYDVIPYHPCFLYNVVLYLSTLQMMIYLAELMIELVPEIKSQMDNLIEIYKERCLIAENECYTRLWKKRGYYMVCQSRDTLFQGGLAGDWIARYAGLEPVIHYNRARTHSAWQSKALVESHDTMPDGNLPGLPLTYSEANPDGKEIKMKISYLKIPVKNYFWQVLSYQAMEAIYLGRVEAGLAIIRRLYEKIYKQGYPWDANLYALPGFVYMTHPVIWAFFNAMTGAALDVPRGKLTLSPRLLPNTESFRIPFFFPKFWAFLHYNSKTKKAMIDIYKSFDETFKITKIVNRTINGELKEIMLEEPFKIINGAILNVNLDS